MARILIDGRMLAHAQTSGVERYVSEISEHLPRAGAAHNFEIARPPTRARIIHHLWEHLYLPLRCAGNRFDVLFCPANIAPVWKPGRVKMVLTIHGIAFRYSPESYSKSFYRYYSYLVPRSLKNADAIIAVSHAEKKSILSEYSWVSGAKIHVIASGIDHAVFNTAGKRQARELLQRRYGIHGDFVLAVGLFKPVKNLSSLVEAYREVHARIGAQLVLLGGAPPSGRLEIPGVTALGYIDADLRYFYQAAMMLVFPSRYEGFGFPPLEAMACGCPVIVSKAGALPEVCGDAAFYLEGDDAKSIAAAMVMLIADKSLRTDFIERGFRRVKNFSWDKTAAETVKVFESLCG